ncbi:hypothetical protein HPB52_002918 [Rhipicephalus sanguineus]|uniref:Uncharacterized protein n=1 Tax=Rhipicephalus sanguineus TaxID=34632 RepID=A0A9D4PI72_RHISA|nr:hypothetical protein HPB52_002918 [Rhipicephalus sanguineus]
MERTNNKRAACRSQSTTIVNEVNQLIQSEQFELSTLYVLISRLQAVKADTLGLLEDSMYTLAVSSPTSMAYLPTPADGDPPVASERKPTRPQQPLLKQLPQFK